jgi:hypothetical protein
VKRKNRGRNSAAGRKERKAMFKVYEESCNNCLLSKDRIVSPESAKATIEKCLEAQTHFICHKSSMEGGEVCCNRFFKKFKNRITKLQIFERLNMITFEKQQPAKPLLPYRKYGE